MTAPAAGPAPALAELLGLDPADIPVPLLLALLALAVLVCHGYHRQVAAQRRRIAEMNVLLESAGVEAVAAMQPKKPCRCHEHADTAPPEGAA